MQSAKRLDLGLSYYMNIKDCAHLNLVLCLNNHFLQPLNLAAGCPGTG